LDIGFSFDSATAIASPHSVFANVGKLFPCEEDTEGVVRPPPRVWALEKDVALRASDAADCGCLSALDLEFVVAEAADLVGGRESPETDGHSLRPLAPLAALRESAAVREEVIGETSVRLVLPHGPFFGPLELTPAEGGAPLGTLARDTATLTPPSSSSLPSTPSSDPATGSHAWRAELTVDFTSKPLEFQGIVHVSGSGGAREPKRRRGQVCTYESN